MAGSIDSPAVFDERALAIGLTSTQLDALHAADLTTLAKLAFSCSYQPGSADDSTFRALLDVIFTAPGPTPGVIGSMRRLHFEAYSVCASDMRNRIEGNVPDGAPRKLATAERSARSDR